MKAYLLLSDFLTVISGKIELSFVPVTTILLASGMYPGNTLK